MKIKLKQLTLVNFKGCRNRTIDFADETFIFGANGTGKTTIFDAFTWLLFGKDSDDRADFDIKTLDERNQAIPMLDHEVIAVLEIGDKTSELRRVLREKWVTKRGSEESVFEGNETTYFVDGVPLKANEFKARISEIIDEQLFKLLTNPMAFNSIKWQERRETLINIVGDLTEDEVLSKLNMSSDQKQTLLNIIQADMKLDDQKKKIAAEIKTGKDEQKTIPARIDEAERSKPQVPEGGFTSLKAKLKAKQNILEEMDQEITDSSKSVDNITGPLKKYKSQVYELESRRDQIKRDITEKVKAEASSNENQLKELEDEKTIAAGNKITITNKIKSLQDEIKAKRSEWAEVNAENFDNSKGSCPTCKQFLPQDEVNELMNTFTKTKNERLDRIQAEGKELSKRLEAEEEGLIKTDEDIERITNKIKTLSQSNKPEKPQATPEQILEEDNEYQKCLKDIASLKETIADLEQQLKAPAGTSELSNKKAAIIKEIDGLQAELFKEREIERADTRIEQLKKQEKEIAQAIAEAEKKQFLISSYTKAKIEGLETKINEMFDLVNFKMYEQQINGGETETCVCMVNGVPFSSLNTAAKINAGLDIINTLSKHYDIYAPIFIDHRESVTELQPLNTQIINLVVSADDTELRVEL